MNATDCSFAASRAVRFFASIAVSCAALCASATMYYWKGGADPSNCGAYDSTGNWSTKGVSDEDASSIPGVNDDLYSAQSYAMDLGGKSYSLRKWPDGEDKENHLYLQNGTLTFTGESRPWYMVIDLANNANLAFADNVTYSPGMYSSHGNIMTIGNGCSVSILGTLRIYSWTATVEQGGTLTINPSSYSSGFLFHNDSQYDSWVKAYGLVNMPKGLKASSGPNSSKKFSFYLFDGGEIALGGPLDMNSSSVPGTYTFNIGGGTLSAANNVSFSSFNYLDVTNDFTASVAANGTLDLSGFTFDSGVTCTKTGAGTLVLATTAQKAAISAGALGIASATTYDLSNVTFGSGSQVALTAMGARIDSADSSIANATFTANLTSAPAGTDILHSSNATLLAQVKGNLEAGTPPSGMELVITDETLSLEMASADAIKKSGNLLSDDSWGGGSVPDAGSAVSIDGADVVAEYTSGNIPAWESIEVKNGATLRISGTAVLPPIILNKSATLEIADGGSADIASGLTCSATASQVPVLSVASGATLHVPGGMKFSNVNIDLKGTIAVSPSGTITFGYAAAGETTYIGFNSVGGKITNNVVWSYDGCRIGICCPEQGGTVIAPEPIVFKDMPVTGEYLPTYSDNYWNGFSLGVNNPESVSFNVVFDNTRWNASGNLYVKGGATFRLKNNSVYMNAETYSLYNRHAEVSGNGCIVIESGSELRIDAMGNSGDTPAVFNQSAIGRESIIVADGGIYDNYRTAGNGNGVFAASNAVLTVHVPVIDEDVTGSSGTKHYCNTNVVFEGFSSVSLATNSTMTFTTRNSSSSYSRFTDASGDRVVALADVPITGAGSIALDNANVNKFGVIVTCGSNTATGSASVVAPGEGEGETTLYFADGANWAGTVEAGGFVMTNLVNATAACTNSFGTLNLASGGEVKIRVWKTGDAITTHDGLNVGKYINNGGRITLVQMGEQFVAADKFILGTIDDDSPLPVMSKPWRAERDGEGNLFAKASSGLSIVVR